MGAETTEKTTSQAFPGHTAQTFRSATHRPDIRVVGVDDDGLSHLLEPGYEASKILREYDLNRAAGRLFSSQMTFERLPVPVERYDQWARDQDGGYFGPRTIRYQISDLEEYGDEIESSGAKRHLFDTVEQLQYAATKLGESNPMYDALTSQIKEALAVDDSVAVFLPKKTWCRAVRDILVEDGVVTRLALERSHVTITEPDSARGLRVHDRLVMVGPQRPQYAGFYVHPAIGEAIVLTYRGEWISMIERNLQRFVRRLNDATPGTDYRPYQTPTVGIELPQSVRSDDPTPGSEPRKVDEPSASTPSESDGPNAHGVPEDEPSRKRGNPGRVDKGKLAELFDQGRSADYHSDGGDRYERAEGREFRIEMRDGSVLKRCSRILKRRETPEKDGPYYWVSPSALERDDRVAVLDAEVEERLWDEWLSEAYSSDLEQTSVFEDVETWYETLSVILGEIIRAGPPAVRNHYDPHVRRVVIKKTAEIDREEQTRWRWFESVALGESAMDLARSPSLTIGPRRATDIGAVGDAFDKPAVSGERARQIEESMKRIRGANTSQGHKFRLDIKQRMNSLEENEVREAATDHHVESVEEV